MTDTPNERLEPHVGATVELDEVGEDILYDSCGEERDYLLPGQRGVIVEFLDATFGESVWRVRMNNGELVALIDYEFTVVQEAPVNDPALYDVPLLLFEDDNHAN